MLVYAVAAAQALVYLWAIPVRLVLLASDRNGLRFGSGLAAFDSRAARRRAARQLAKPLGQSGKRPGGGRAWRVLRRLRLSAVRLDGSVCLGDAASTALACGAINAAARALLSAESAGVRPDFGGFGVRVSLRVTVRAGQLARAALRAVLIPA